MRTLLIVIAILLSGISHAEEITNRLISIQNYYFMFYSGDDYKEIFRTPDNSSMYGYGLLSNKVAMFAYQNPMFAEAVAVIDVIDTDSGKTIFKKEFGGAGETSFDFSQVTGKGVFNDSEGLSVIQLSKGKIIIYPVSGITDEYPSAPFWVDTHTIGYFVYKDEKQLFKTVKVQ